MFPTLPELTSSCGSWYQSTIYSSHTLRHKATKRHLSPKSLKIAPAPDNSSHSDSFATECADVSKTSRREVETVVYINQRKCSFLYMARIDLLTRYTPRLEWSQRHQGFNIFNTSERPVAAARTRCHGHCWAAAWGQGYDSIGRPLPGSHCSLSHLQKWGLNELSPAKPSRELLSGEANVCQEPLALSRSLRLRTPNLKHNTNTPVSFSNTWQLSRKTEGRNNQESFFYFSGGKSKVSTADRSCFGSDKQLNTRVRWNYIHER